MALFLDLCVGDSIEIGNVIATLRLEEKRGHRCRMRIEADQSISVRMRRNDPAVSPGPSTSSRHVQPLKRMSADPDTELTTHGQDNHRAERSESG